MTDALKLDERDIHEFFTDGRKFSFVVERRIAYEVIKGSLAPSEGSNFDAIDPTGDKWEVRSITNRGVYFCPSNMKGKGRRFNEAGFLQKLKEIKGYVLADLIPFPDIPFWYISADTVLTWWSARRLGKTSQVSRKRALALIEWSSKPQ